MTIYITVSYRDHRLKPVYAKVVSSPEKIRQLIYWAVDRHNGRCYHCRGKYLKLFLNSDHPIELMCVLKSIVKENDFNAEISDSDMAKL